ncbi:beta-N-acetylhexosaminidase [Macrococcus armenti]|uniref:beta-N-acetylhexosaminidase n=1 Tax=Macrococcus armenti TaxID=2875764 RepID=UPI001CD038A3|nr:beta-N-acetylhexosaminidase [Macrococcus armenti]UBH07805.1 beta-N-acetylhexosaminidase [Macrococcus armenti]UBH10039.1 beta-N-acetylhexosaminidase [Macrococcus armenti]UBH14585.1 beta-N-acetylhexosaminidase [Macrococcus armenti]UBH16946.1 beta-N-acetylhexosaminidase [Macrococcus armenti]UBH19209.1 beta-N-acetylhexosaminidase [Macrococcus armenti]
MKRFFYFYIVVLCILLTACSNTHSIESEQKSKLSVKPLKQIDFTYYYLNQLSMDEKIAQMMLLGFDGTDYNATLKQYQNKNVGGVILFKRNIANTPQVRQLTSSLNESTQQLPMFIGIDQEGGVVNRLPASVQNIESAYEIGLINDLDYSFSRGKYVGDSVKAHGFNLDFAPVLDIWSNPNNKVIGNRSFGTDAKTVTRMSDAFKRGINSAGVITSGKHFPGHGDTVTDSHVALPVSNKNLSELEASELIPFKYQIDKKIDMMMISHILYPEIDRQNPASLSNRIVDDILKDKLNYNGVIITDDLSMGAITNQYDLNTAVVRAIQAGETMVLIGSHVGDVDALIHSVKAAVRDGKIDEKIIDENNEKIIRLKLKYGIL